MWFGRRNVGVGARQGIPGVPEPGIHIERS